MKATDGQTAFESFYSPAPETIPPATGADFDGPCYDPEHDHARLSGQLLRVYTLLRDGQWRTLLEIGEATGDPGASISAQLRHLRKAKFGGFLVEKRWRGERKHGLWEYRLPRFERGEAR